MRRLLDEVFGDPEVDALVRRLQQARHHAPPGGGPLAPAPDA
jgi:hypothetical protein